MYEARVVWLFLPEVLVLLLQGTACHLVDALQIQPQLDVAQSTATSCQAGRCLRHIAVSYVGLVKEISTSSSSLTFVQSNLHVLYFFPENWTQSTSGDDHRELPCVFSCAKPVLQKLQPINISEPCFWSFWSLNTTKTKTSDSLGDHVHISRSACNDGQRMVGQCGFGKPLSDQ
ncbi:hypothetical protein AAFF_G00239980 [Aldrovandia affinis]|uniref:Secreted protein n=1 Tax=Aldrovandia affinis TaxID=143900 RepID=A0AAD7SUE3_9TELE|nr:hypothetical protein AAFF_G00239980 [Aldrovandia affinis]